MSVFETNTFKQYESEISNLKTQIEEVQERIEYLQLRNNDIETKHLPDWINALYGTAPWQAEPKIEQYKAELEANKSELREKNSALNDLEGLLNRNKSAQDKYVTLYGQYISEGYSKSDAEAKAAKKAENTLNPFYLKWWFWVIVAVAIGVPTFLIIRKNLKK